MKKFMIVTIIMGLTACEDFEFLQAVQMDFGNYDQVDSNDYQPASFGHNPVSQVRPWPSN